MRLRCAECAHEKLVAFSCKRRGFCPSCGARRLKALQAASRTYRIALGPRAGQKVLSVRTVASRDEKTTAAMCADAHGFSLHAAVRCGAHQRKALERLRCCITRPAIVNGRFLEHAVSAPGRYVALHSGHYV